MSGCVYEHSCNPRSELDHALLLCLSGVIHVSAGAASARVVQGDFLLLRDLHAVRIEHAQPAEVIVLISPLPSPALQRVVPQSLLHRSAGGLTAAMLMQWIRDICEDHGWRSRSAAESMDSAVRALLQEVLLGEQAPGLTRPDRASIEREVERRLGDPSLTPADLAESFGCSVRTLHRIFAREGGESLGRFIQRLRVEACAARLRQPWDGEVLSITDLASQFAFASASHFSTVFRSRYGMSPSAYRQRYTVD